MKQKRTMISKIRINRNVLGFLKSIILTLEYRHITFNETEI